MRRTNAETVALCNRLARRFYAVHGCSVTQGYRFDQATHPDERRMWNLAVLAFDYIEGTDIEDVLAQMEDD